MQASNNMSVIRFLLLVVLLSLTTAEDHVALSERRGKQLYMYPSFQRHQDELLLRDRLFFPGTYINPPDYWEDESLVDFENRHSAHYDDNPLWLRAALSRTPSLLDDDQQQVMTCPACPAQPDCPATITTHQQELPPAAAELPSEQLITSCSTNEPTYTAATSGNITIRFSPGTMKCLFRIVSVWHPAEYIKFVCYQKTFFSSFYVNGADPPENGQGIVNKDYISASNYLDVTLSTRNPAGNSIACRWNVVPNPNRSNINKKSHSQ